MKILDDLKSYFISFRYLGFESESYNLNIFSIKHHALHACNPLSLPVTTHISVFKNFSHVFAYNSDIIACTLHLKIKRERKTM